MKKYQLTTPILENVTGYCSVINVYDAPLFFISKDRERALVYTEKELPKAKEHFQNLNIEVLEKEVTVLHKRTIDV
jgi:hypothetical protein